MYRDKSAQHCDEISAISPVFEQGEPRWVWPAVAITLIVIALASMRALHDFPATLSWPAAFAGVREVIDATGPAAVRVWCFWLLSGLLASGIALRLDPALELADALLLGAAGPWILGTVLGFACGPWGLLNATTIWGLIALAAAWLWRNPPQIKLAAPSTGQLLAMLAVALLAVSYLPLQLASPVVPFMDVLSYPSSVQRMMTFHRYLPFNNDPYGCWGPYAQTPYLELFYATLAMGSGVHLAVLAESAAMMPMAALLIFGAYRLGKSIIGDTAGGFAALFLFSTCLFRRAQGMRGTAVAFAVVALGLAFFLDPQARRFTFAAGATMLGIALGSHAIIGGFAVVAAALGLVLPLAERNWNRVVAGSLALSGSALIGLPEVLIGLAHPVPVIVLPVSVATGIALIYIASSLFRTGSLSPSGHDSVRELRWVNVALIAGLLILLSMRVWMDPSSLFVKVFADLPGLSIFCLAGLIGAIAVVTVDTQKLRSKYLGLFAIPLLVAVAADLIDPTLRTLGDNNAAHMMTSDVAIKLWDYWCPFFMIFPASFLIAAAWTLWSRPLTLVSIMFLLLYPLRPVRNAVYYDSLQHTITENWAFNLDTAARGYWAGHRDRRWTFDHSEMGLINVLNGEIQAGRITPSTHILHLTHNISPWSLVQFSIFTGVNDDPIEYDHDPNNLWEGGSRVRGLDQLPTAMRSRPPYILVQDPAPSWFGDPPGGYRQIWEYGSKHLYRRLNLESKSKQRLDAPGGYAPGILMAMAALLIAVWPRASSPQAAKRPPQPISG